MSEEPKPGLKDHLLALVITAPLLAGTAWLYDFLGPVFRRPPFNGTLLADLRLVVPVLLIFALLSVLHWLAGRIQAKRGKESPH
ncbi:hypothetical protein [Kiloniella sp. b19]|uniref:hypothetical protein n=1 Tax=Kiloniella sp. GXU_MW_B19 TaxID=3141326 RepID=UPI0031D26F74